MSSRVPASCEDALSREPVYISGSPRVFCFNFRFLLRRQLDRRPAGIGYPGAGL